MKATESLQLSLRFKEMFCQCYFNDVILKMFLNANFGYLDKERWQGMLTYISDGTYLQLCHIIVPGKRERNCKAVPSEKNKLSSDSASKREKKTKSFCHSERSEESHRNKVLLSF